HRTGERPTRGAPPSVHRDETRRRGARRRGIHGFERQKKVRPDAMIGGIAAIDFDDRDWTEGRFGSDTPPFISNLYRIAGVQTGLTHGARLLHALFLAHTASTRD